jgi:hypothetical protein
LPKSKNDKNRPGFQSTASTKTESGRIFPGRLLAGRLADSAAGKNAVRPRGHPDLLLVDGIADSQTLAALGTTTAQDGATPTVFHAGHEALLVGTLTIVRLESSFHDKTFLKCKILSSKNSKKSAQIKGGKPLWLLF